MHPAGTQGRDSERKIGERGFWISRILYEVTNKRESYGRHFFTIY